MYEYAVNEQHAQQMLHYSQYNEVQLKWLVHFHNSLNISYYTH